MRQGAAAVILGTGLISGMTAAAREGVVPLRLLVASPDSVADGRVWLLATSAIVADRPAAASILGFAVVGLATLAVCGSRVVWTAAALGHICSAALVYVAIELARDGSVLSYPDYGTSAIIAAWIGAIGYVLWLRGRRWQAVALCLASGLLGWFFKGHLTVLDTEHIVALVIGAASVWWLGAARPREVVRPQLRRPQVVHAIGQQRRRMDRVLAQLHLL